MGENYFLFKLVYLTSSFVQKSVQYYDSISIDNYQNGSKYYEAISVTFIEDNVFCNIYDTMALALL